MNKDWLDDMQARHARGELTPPVEHVVEEAVERAHDDLDAPRGILLGVVLGVVLLAVLGGCLWAIFPPGTGHG